MLKEIILPLSVWVLVILVLTAALTGVWLWDLSGECAGNGGTFSIEGGTAWCRY